MRVQVEWKERRLRFLGAPTEQLRLIFETAQKPGEYRDSRRYRRTATTRAQVPKACGAKKIFAAILAVIRYDTCCFVPVENIDRKA
jgi:hypothetical protein